MLYAIRTERLANGEVLLTIVVAIVLFGIRKEGDKKDIYRVAEKLAKLGLLAPRFDEKKSRNNGPGKRR